jgi:hypothetical protein
VEDEGEVVGGGEELLHGRVGVGEDELGGRGRSSSGELWPVRFAKSEFTSSMRSTISWRSSSSALARALDMIASVKIGAMKSTANEIAITRA